MKNWLPHRFAIAIGHSGVVTAFSQKSVTTFLTLATTVAADAVARRLMTIPGIGAITATALAALAAPAETFKRGRDFAA